MRRAPAAALAGAPSAAFAGAVVGCAAALGACGGAGATNPAAPIPRSLLAQARPIGVGARFRPGVDGTPAGRCRPRLGDRFQVHIELFAANRVVILPAGIGTLPPRRWLGGMLTGARCFGELVTLQPTGVVLVAPGAGATVGTLFRSLGQPLGARRLAGFTAPPGGHVRAYIDGTAARRAPSGVPLTPHAEIVLEVGPYVPPHASFRFTTIPAVTSP